MPFAPIWKDRTVTLASNAAYADFEIHVGSLAGELIYSGRAYARPGETDPVARINDVCAAYLSVHLPNLGNGYTSMRVSETFVTAVGGVAVDTITFVNDWSYDHDRVITASTPLSDPVTGELDPRQVLFFSVLDGTATVTAVLHFQDGTTLTVVVPVVHTADFDNGFNEDFSIDEDNSGSGTAILDLSTFSGLNRVTVNGKNYTVREQGCARYLVAYVNAFGGWDTLILDGNYNCQDALVRHTLDRIIDNADPTARGRKDYAIEIAPSWTLRTGFLTDDQSLRMRHLLNSVEVYLCDLADESWRPVVLTDTETPVQNFKGNGRRFNEYTFNAQLAQERFRR